MGKAHKLINKLTRRAKYFKDHQKGKYDKYDEIDLREEKMARSPKAYKLARAQQRRYDRNLGIDSVGVKPKVSKRKKITTVQRFDFGVSDFGIRITMPTGIIADIGLQPGDIVRFLSGNLSGIYLKVVSLVDATHARLEDSLKESNPGTKEKTQVTTVADVAGSLNNKYFTLHSAANATSYYVWYNVNGAGVDPAPGGTGIMVAIPTGASATAVALATATAVDLNVDFVANNNANNVFITNAAVGIATDATAATSTFTIAILVQGSAAVALLSESNIHARFQLSDVKGSYK